MGGPQYTFKEPFAVKTIREKTYLKSKTRARKEVENMKDLRYPHVAALLGTFTYTDRLSILIFPAAPCDLHIFLTVMSKDMRDVRRGRSQVQDLANINGREDTPESRSSTSSIRERPASPRFSAQTIGSPHAALEPEDWPLRLALPAKAERLRGYFVCLSQALSYIHESDVRHKDIKPENILIDASGSVVLTDFGISRRFPKKAPHITNDQWEWTRKYASPEIMKGKKMPRDDPSDVFSLGCVFLEMTSLILGRDLDTMCDHYATFLDNSGIEDAYYCNLERVYTWVDHLRKSQSYGPRSVPDLTGERIGGQDFMPDPTTSMVEALDTVQRMLNIEPSARPPAKGLWQQFQHVSSQMCRDCDPRLPNDIWTPSSEQKNAANKGTSRRRSMQHIPEEASDNPSTEAHDGQVWSNKADDGRLLSASYRPDQGASRGRRASSPYAGRRQTSSSKLPIPPYIYDGPEPITLSGEENMDIERTLSEVNKSKVMSRENLVAPRSVSPKKRRPMSESHLQYASHAPGASGSAMPPRRGKIGSPLPYVPSVDGLPVAQNSMSQSSTTVSAPNQERVSSPPPAPSLHGPPAAQNSSGSSHSLAVKKQKTNSDPMNLLEKPHANGPSNHQKADHPQSDTQIIVYDLAKKRAYVTAYAQLEGSILVTTCKCRADPSQRNNMAKIIFLDHCPAAVNILKSVKKARL
ncbi:MAG: hypothetical protein Q9224_004196 [Gallowayella concinna]